MNLLRTLALGAAMTTAVAADQVLVLSAQKELLHTSPSATSFSSIGLAELAMDALGVGTVTVAQSTEAATTSPLQADIFQPADAYALVYVPDAADDGAMLDAVVDSTTFPDASYHRVFPISHRDAAAVYVPQVTAQKLTAAFGAEGRVVCSGSPALCAWKALAPPVAVDSAAVQRVFAAHAFLDQNDAVDARLATELAQVDALTATLATTRNAKRTLFVVGFSDVASPSRSQQAQVAARQAIATHVGAFLSALQQSHAAAGAQVVAARPSAAGVSLSSPARTQLSDMTSVSRLLASLAAEPVDDDDDDASDSDSDDDDAGTTNAEKVTLEQIAEYQIVLWTSVLLVVMLLLVILAMCNMNTGRDSLLYAKFITDANHRKGD